MSHQPLNIRPEFISNLDGNPSAVSLDLKSYVALLLAANITDPRLWPPGFQEGAAALARVREIEFECVSEQGAFDWQKLPTNVQDEYDVLCCVLDRLQDDDNPVDWASYKAEHKGRGA